MLEGAVIVFSILLAFAIDAWWAEVGERKEEQLALVGLNADFEGYLLELERIREKNEKRIESTRALMSLAGPHPEVVNGEILQDHLGRVIVMSC